jgi:hypothetical protein
MNAMAPIRLACPPGPVLVGSSAIPTSKEVTWQVLRSEIAPEAGDQVWSG